MVDIRRLKLAMLAFIFILLPLNTAAAPLNPPAVPHTTPANLAYATETTWRVSALPNLTAAAGTIPHNFSHGEAVFNLGDEIIHGFRPGKEYKEMYIRDIAWGMETAQYYYPDAYLREPIEAFLRRQYTDQSRSLDGDFGVLAGAGAIGGIITPRDEHNKQTITTDEETSLIHAAYLYYALTQNAPWLASDIEGQTVIERLNRAADWLYARRLDPELQLLWRGHTTDWGDVKFEKGPPYTDFNPAQDHQTASIYDQALALMALRELARMNAAAGDSERAAQWSARAEALKRQTNALLWQPEWGFYRTHRHITPLEHDFDEDSMVSISNALAVYSGLTDFEQNQSIFNNLERVRQEAGANKPGLSLYPYYPNRWPNMFFDYLGMGYGNYQNGGLWDWWGGVQIKAEFQNGFAEVGLAHLLQVVNDWQTHPGNIIEWHSTTSLHHEGSHYYSAAAGTMGSAIIEGFFGLKLDGNGLTIQPRLGLYDGFIRVYQPATDRYAAYEYDWGQDAISIDYGTNATGAIRVMVLQRPFETIQAVTLDDAPIDFTRATIGHDTYIVFSAPPGQHRLQLLKTSPSKGVRRTDSLPPASPSDEPHKPSETVQPESVAAAPQTTGDSPPHIAPRTDATTGLSPHSRPTSQSGTDRQIPLLDLLQLIFTALIIVPALVLIVFIGVRGRLV